MSAATGGTAEMEAVPCLLGGRCAALPSVCCYFLSEQRDKAIMHAACTECALLLRQIAAARKKADSAPGGSART